MIYSSGMSSLALPFLYLRWHYSRALRDFLGVWYNYLWFVGNVFSAGTLFRTLLLPLRLIEEDKGNLVLDPVRYAQGLLVNVIMRIVGAVTRLILIVVALLLWTILLAVGAVMFILWLILPIMLLQSLYAGITLLL